MRVNYLLFILFLLVPIHLYSTCIVIIKTKSAILVGADSRRTLYEINAETGEVKESKNNTYCKIHHVGEFYFAISGFDDGNQLINAENACKNSKSLSEVIEKYSKVMKVQFEQNIEMVRNKNRERYKKRFVGNDIGATSFFCINKNGTPQGESQIITVTFSILNKPDQKTEVKVVKLENEPITFLGIFDHLNKLSKNEITSIFKGGDFVKAIQTLIRIEIKHHPSLIGEPIDLLILNSDGEKWIAKKENCRKN